jgi:WbqC-like protein family
MRYHGSLVALLCALCGATPVRDAHAVVIHQPYFLPWCGFINKLLGASHYVVLDNVFYRQRHYHNRVRIRKWSNESGWLTLPVCDLGNDRLISSKLIVNGGLDRTFETLRREYARSRYFSWLWPLLVEVKNRVNDRSLMSFNVASILLMCRVVGLQDVELRFASEFYSGDDRTERLIEICRALAVPRLVMGVNSMSVHDLDDIENAGIEIVTQVPNEKAGVYNQIHGGFVDGLSFVDALFNVGPQGSLEVARRWGELVSHSRRKPNGS